MDNANIYKHSFVLLCMAIIRKKIKKWGNSPVVVLTKEEVRLRGLSIGDIVDVEIKLITPVEEKVKA